MAIESTNTTARFVTRKSRMRFMGSKVSLKGSLSGRSGPCDLDLFQVRGFP